jgi:transposase
MSITLEEILKKEPNFRPRDSFSSIGKVLRDSGQFGRLIGNRKYDETGENPSRKYVWLGRVVTDEVTKEELFYLPELGVYQLSMDEGFKPRPEYSYGLHKPERYMLQYGSMWVYEELLQRTKFGSVINAIAPELTETLNALLAYKLTHPTDANYRGLGWYEKSYVKLLYPNAAMSSGALSIFLSEIGKDYNYKKFFNLYLNYLINNDNTSKLIDFPLLIDSTGLPNDIKIPITALSNHNGDINNEIRLIYVTDKISNLPIYFHYISGNIVDVSTLKYVIMTLKLYNIDIKSIIMDAGYNSVENLKYLNSLNIDFITRMQENRSEYKNIIKEHGVDIEHPKYLVEYQNKTIFCKKLNVTLDNLNFYAYLCYDGERKTTELNTYRKNFFKHPDSYDVKNEKFNSLAKFVLISNHDFETNEIMQNYYQRQQIEQNFDVTKNSAHIIPLRTHNEETFRGHLLVSFIQTIILLLLDKQLVDAKIDPLYVFSTMNDLYIDIYDKDIKILHSLRKEEKNIIQELKLEPKYGIESSEYKHPYLKQIAKSKTRGRPLGRKNKQQRYLQKKSDATDPEILHENEYSAENSYGQVSIENELALTKTVEHNKRGRGRPKGSKNKLNQPNKSSNFVSSSSSGIVGNGKKTRGRPKGSKNKLK